MLSKSEMLLRLYTRLKQGPCTIDILKDWRHQNGFHFSDRTLYRYMAELENNQHNLLDKGENLEVFFGEYQQKTWKLIFDKSAGDFTGFDINTFYLAKHFVPKSIFQNRKASFDKIEKSLYAENSKRKFEYTADVNNLAFGNTDFYDINYSEKQQAQIDELIVAVQTKRKIRPNTINGDLDTYHDGYGVGNILCPIAFKYHRGVLQICTFNETTNHVAIIPLDTLADFSLLDHHFDANKYKPSIQIFFDTHLGITENIDDKTYDIAMEFSEGTGKFVQQFFWHGSQQFTALENGNILFSLHCGINRELVGWIFQWMSNVKVHQPELLRQLVIEKYKACLEMHTNDKPLQYNNSFARQK